MADSSPLYRLPSSTPGFAASLYLRSAALVVGLLAGALWGTTQWCAWQLAFSPHLGVPLLAISAAGRIPFLVVGAIALGSALVTLAARRLRRLALPLGVGGLATIALAVGPIYAPWDFLVWDWRFGRNPALKPVFTTGHWLIAVPAHGAVLLAMLAASRAAKRASQHSDSHGSARWASDTEVRGSGLTASAGLFLAHWRKRAGDGPGVYLRHAGPEHVLGFAPSRSGKGVGWVLPTLLTWPHSVVVHDLKGENWALSAGWRRDRLGSLCLRFDPTCRYGTAARYNPLLEVRRGPEEVRDVQNIADMLVDPDGTGAKDHWDLTAQELLVGALLHVLYVGREKSLRGCLELLSQPSRPIEDVLDEMMTTEHDARAERPWIDRTSGQLTKTHPVIAGTARALLNKSDNERSSVLSSAVRCLSLLRDEVVAENTSACDFSILDLMHHERPVSLYLTVPPSDLARTRPLLRLVIHQVGRRLTERMTFASGHVVAHYRHRLLLLMDEFPSLGRLEFFQTQLAYLPGYGIQAFLVVQDLSQLHAAYGRDESIVSNCAVRVAFAPNRIETARLLSDMAGTMTVHRSRRMYSGHRLAPWLSHVMASEEESQRPLLTPDEALRLPEEAALVFSAGHRPILAEKISYYEDPRFLERAQIPPPPRSDRIEAGHCDWDAPARSTDKPSTSKEPCPAERVPPDDGNPSTIRTSSAPSSAAPPEEIVSSIDSGAANQRTVKRGLL